MNLNDIRKNINSIDEQLEKLFAQRMDLCMRVAEYKKENSLPIFQSDREKEILKRVHNNMPDGLKNSGETFFAEIMDISKHLQFEHIFDDTKKFEHIIYNKNTQIISFSFSIPNKASSLHRLLTKFSIADIDILKIESHPKSEYENIFHIDIKGSLHQKHIYILLSELENELDDFKIIENTSET